MKAAFIDRDGTLIYEPADGLVRPQDFRVLPGVYETLKALKLNGFTLVMVTNQHFKKSADHEPFFHETQEMLATVLRDHGLEFDYYFLCPHGIDENCTCRKPKTGMVDEFLKKHDIDLSKSVVIGDREENDGGLAKNLCVRYVKVGPNGNFATYQEVINVK